jgi:hypothetical protein
MRAVLKVISGLAVTSLSFVAMAGSAHAVAIPFSTGPFSIPGDPAGVIPAGTFVSGTATEDFTFTLAGSGKATMQMQASAVSDSSPQTLAFTLFSGSPGSGSFLANSGGSATAATLLQKLTPGNYYAELNTVAAPNSLVTGGLALTPVPEPAAWGMMLLGVAGLGAVARRRRMSALT